MSHQESDEDPYLKNELDDRVDLDDLFPYVGEFGRYQKLLTWFIVLPACIPCGLATFNQLFMMDDIPHLCTIPNILQERTNLTIEELRKLLLPQISENFDDCHIQDIGWSNINSSIWSLDDLEAILNDNDTTSKLIICPYGWDYIYDERAHSIVQSFDLVCGKEFYPTLTLFLTNVGGLFGVFLFGLISDKLGRKASYFICLTCQIFGGIGCIFARNYWTWLAFRIVNGLTVPAIYQIPFIICLELVGQTYRSFVTVMTCLFYVGGMMLLSPIAYLITDWRHLSFFTSAPFILYYCYLWFLPESPRWLLAKNRADEALQILNQLAKVNEKELPTNLVKKLKRNASLQKREPAVKRGIIDLFRTPNMRLKTLLLTFCWFANASVYIGLSYYGPALGDNPYLSFFLGSAIELPGYLLCWVVMDRFGRRWPMCLCMIIGGIFDIATVLLPQDSTALLMIFYLIAKLGISASYLIIYPFAGELYPTEIRGLGLGFSAYIGGIGICAIPIINYLGRSHLLVPLIIMGIVSVLGGIAALRLPETINAALPATIEEGEEFGKNFTIFDCISCPKGMAEDDSIASKPPDENGESIPLRRVHSFRRQNTIPSMDENLLTPAPQRRKKLTRQATSLEAPVDSSGAIMITPWW